MINLPLTVQIKEEEHLLRESEKKYRSLFENMLDGFAYCKMIYDENSKPIDFIYCEVNDAFENLTGLKRQQVIGKKVTEAIPDIKNTNPELFDIYGRVAETGREERFEIFFKPLRIWLSILAYSPKKGYFAAVFENITKRKETEQALQQNEQQFSALFDANPEAAVFYGPDFRVIDANERFSKLFGYSLDEIKGKDIVDLIVPDDAKEETNNIRERIKSGLIEIITTRKRKDGLEIPLLLTGSPVCLEGKIIGSMFVFKDIGEIITAQEELCEALSKTQLLNEKLQVVGSLTRHDVRNKLSTITSCSYILKKKLKDRPEIIQTLDMLEQSVKDSVKIFDFAKVYEQIGVEDLVEIDVEKVVSEAADIFSSLPFKIYNDCKGLTVKADSLLRQLIYNFIDNTRKYAKKATYARISLQRIPQATLLIYEDDGVGIPFENKEHLFKQGFSTGGSTGFGLFLSKKMLEVYGWSIKEEGTPNQGARFVITIPVSSYNTVLQDKVVVCKEEASSTKRR
jgi:PAS domain S-box-containing protein